MAKLHVRVDLTAAREVEDDSAGVIEVRRRRPGRLTAREASALRDDLEESLSLIARLWAV